MASVVQSLGIGGQIFAEKQLGWNRRTIRIGMIELLSGEVIPDHSKYNPVERTFGWLEKHWNGSLLDSVETVLNFAKTLTFNGKQPSVNFVEEIYQTGVKLTEQEMAKVEEQIERLPKLRKWFISIIGNPI